MLETPLLSLFDRTATLQALVFNIKHFDIKHDKSFHKYVSNNEEEIIVNLGGIVNIITLCLTHPSVSNNTDSNLISKANILSLQQIFDSFGTSVNTIANYGHVNMTKSEADALMMLTPNNNYDIDTDNSILNVPLIGNETRRSNENKSNHIMAKNMYQYYTSSIILSTRIENCLYFKLFSIGTANEWINRIFYHKRFLIGMLSAFWIFGAISLAIHFIGILIDKDNNEWIVFECVFRSLCMLFTIVIFVLLSLSLNFRVMKIILDTFDFWFKMWNMVLWLISLIWINIEASPHSDDNVIGLVTSEILLTIGTALGCCLVFFIDAIPMGYQLKNYMSISGATLIFAQMISGYLRYKDVRYNPFNESFDQFTTISLKSIHLGAYFNIGLFTLKPILSYVLRKMYNKIYSRQPKSIIKSNESKRGHYDRLITVYKRPKIQWQTKYAWQIN